MSGARDRPYVVCGFRMCACSIGIIVWQMRILHVCAILVSLHACRHPVSAHAEQKIGPSAQNQTSACLRCCTGMSVAAAYL